MAVETSEEGLRATGQLTRGTDLRDLVVGLDSAVARGEGGPVALDFGHCTAITEAVMLPLLPQIVRLRESGEASFTLNLPWADDIKRLFTNTNWAHFIDPDKFPQSFDVSYNVPAQRFEDEAQMWQAYESILKFVQSRSGISADGLEAVEWTLWEVMENVLSHAASKVGGFVQGTAFQSGVEFVVADAGIGIPESIGMPDQQLALYEAVREGGTRDSGFNGGNGLYGSFQIGRLSRGQFEINSQKAVLFFNHYLDRADARLTNGRLDGTAVRCRIGAEHTDLLERALEFAHWRGAKTNDGSSGTSGVERMPLFSIGSSAAHEVGSRAGGVRVRESLRKLIDLHNGVAVDFEGVSVMSSSFADEVFGRLFVELGPRGFMSCVEVRNASRTIDGLIDRAIVQRTKFGNPVSP